MKSITLLLLAVWLAGCGLLPRYQYSRAGYNGLPLDRGLAECRFESEKATAAADTDEARDYGYGDVFSACMEAKGFRLIPSRKGR